MLNQKFGSRFNEALKTNFTLMGLHCEGNKFRTNALGFVVEAGNRFDRGTFFQKNCETILIQYLYDHKMQVIYHPILSLIRNRIMCG